MYEVDEPCRFEELPEAGQGFHLGRDVDGGNGMFFILNHLIALPLDSLIAVRSGDDDDLRQLRSAILQADVALSENYETKVTTLPVRKIVPLEDVDAASRLMGDPMAATVRRAHARVHGSPPLPRVSAAWDRFVRFSAFRNDRRVSPSGALLPGSYATSKSDSAAVPNALAAVGRYALPSPFPPIHQFEIDPGAGTRLLVGTVAPAYGQAGGGMEAEFVSGTSQQTVRYLGPLVEY